MKLKIVFSILILICLLVPGFFASVSCMHQGPIFNIGNNFDQPVTVYFEGQKMGKINPGKNRIFYPNEVLTKDNSDLLVELKSNSGVVLYSRNFTWDELSNVLEGVTGEPYWIGDVK
jgi:hypothetical protein